MTFLWSSLQNKLLLGFFSLLVCTLLVLGWQGYRSARAELRTLTFQHLKTIRETKKFEIEQYFKDLHSRCLSMSESLMTIEAMNAFKKAFFEIDVDPETLERYTQDLKAFYEKDFLPKVNETATTTKKLDDFFPEDPKTIVLQTLYLAHNPNPLAKKSEFSKASDDSAYSRLHAQYHDIFLQYTKRFGYFDIYLVDIDTGHVVFNISKEIDFATNLITGPLKDTGLAKTFNALQKTTNRSFVQLTDFDFYEPSYGVPSAFIGTPIYQGNTKIGCLIFELPINVINNIMTYDKQWQEVGLGDTGETYIIGHDKLMRTISRFFVEDKQTYINKLRALHVNGDIIDKMHIYKTTILLQEITGNAGDDVIQGNTNTRIDSDYLQEISLSSYTPLTIQDVQWYLIAEIDLSEAFAPIKKLSWHILVLTLLILIAVMILAVFLIGVILKPLHTIITHMTQPFISFKEKIPVQSSDEAAIIADYFNKIGQEIGNAIYTIHLADNQLAQALQHTTEKLQTLSTSIEEEAFLSAEIKEQLMQHINELITVHKQCQDLEKQLHDTIERTDL